MGVTRRDISRELTASVSALPASQGTGGANTQTTALPSNVAYTNIGQTFTGTQVFGAITATDGSGLAALNASNIATGTLNAAQLGTAAVPQFAGVGIGTVPGSTVALDVSSTTKGFAPPRMTTTQKNAIGTPAEGLMVYDLTLHKLCIYTGAAWETVTSV